MLALCVQEIAQPQTKASRRVPAGRVRAGLTMPLSHTPTKDNLFILHMKKGVPLAFARGLLLRIDRGNVIEG